MILKFEKKVISKICGDIVKAADFQYSQLFNFIYLTNNKY